ncbi:recombinase RecT [Cupriavidus basilensis]
MARWDMRRSWSTPSLRHARPVTGRMNYEWFGDWDRIAGRFKEVPAKNNPDEKRIVRDWTGEGTKRGLGVRSMGDVQGERGRANCACCSRRPAYATPHCGGQDPRQQLSYLAVKRWARLYCPDVILGRVYTPDELEEAIPVPERDMGKVEDVRKQKPAPASRQPDSASRTSSTAARHRQPT